jgi:hypothetical protein
MKPVPSLVFPPPPPSSSLMVLPVPNGASHHLNQVFWHAWLSELPSVVLATWVSDQSSPSSSFPRQSINLSEVSHHWWLWEQLNLRRISEMGAARSIVVVMVAIHNLERNSNTSQWFCKYSWKLGEKIHVYFHAHTIAKAHHTPTWSLVSFTLNFTPLLWKIVLSLNFYFKFKY